MKLERRFFMLESVIKSCFLTLCGLIPFYYINLDKIQQYNDWRKAVIVPIIWVDIFVFVFLIIIYAVTARREK